jgi:exopolyphosphatase / guanosine-5'-triphosphate,3'-diphosphate pyrophosphatase
MDINGGNMRISAIEIGTNSTKFIIAELTKNGSIEVIKRTSIVNRLSDGMYLENYLQPLAIDKEIEIIGNFIDMSKMQGAELVSIFSTSVLRDAGNKQVLLDSVKERFGVDIGVISGDREAYLAYIACKEIVKDKTQKFVVIDIGGGSTEIIVGNGDRAEQKVSLNVGTVRLTEMFVHHDPIRASELDQISIHIEKEINEMGRLNISGLQLVGTGGTIKSLGTIFFQEDYTNETIINGRVILRHDIGLLFDKLKLLDIERKVGLVGLNPKRADVITTGVSILLTIMKRFSLDGITISTQGVLEGFIIDYLKKTCEV